MLFSATAGQMADRFDKTTMVRIVKSAEILIMTIAGVGFWYDQYELLLFALFLMGLHSTFFGPLKYSMLPDLLRPEELVKGNAYIELGTFLAILIGTISGGLLAQHAENKLNIVLTLMTIAVAGLLMSQFLQRVPIRDPNLKVDLNPLKPTIALTKSVCKQTDLYLAILAISWFWFYGASTLSLLPIFTKDILTGGEQIITTFLAVFTIGIGVGSVLCEKLSFDRLEVGLVPIGSFGLTIFMADLFFAGHQWTRGSLPLGFTLGEFIQRPGSIRLLADFFFLATSGGIFIVPLYTLLQQRSAPELRSRVIGVNNIINSIFMVVSAITLMLFMTMGLTTPQIFLALSLMNLAVAIYVYSVMPEFTLRFICWILVNIMYRLRVIGESHIPKQGPVVLVCNHISWVDWLIIMGCVKRPVRFVIDDIIARTPLIRVLLEDAKVIPIATARTGPHALKAAFDRISEELGRGEVVCIFPEGGISRDGILHEFRGGIEKIIERDAVPVIPMALNGLWGSYFSYRNGKAFAKLPRRFYHRVELNIGEVVPPHQVTAELCKQHVAALSKSNEFAAYRIDVEETP
jgi:1-acyl-sn-glycerol-3-phosphate acyltransferase